MPALFFFSKIPLRFLMLLLPSLLLSYTHTYICLTLPSFSFTSFPLFLGLHFSSLLQVIGVSRLDSFMTFVLHTHTHICLTLPSISFTPFPFFLGLHFSSLLQAIGVSRLDTFMTFVLHTHTHTHTHTYLSYSPFPFFHTFSFVPWSSFFFFTSSNRHVKVGLLYNFCPIHTHTHTYIYVIFV